MAYDPQARRQSNSALIIGIVGLLIAAGAALAYFTTRSGTPETQAPTIVQGGTRTVVVTGNPGPTATPIVITAPQTNTLVVPVPGAVVTKPGTTTTVTRNTTITRNNTRIIQPPASPVTTPVTGSSGAENGNSGSATAPVTGSDSNAAVAPTTTTDTTGTNSATGNTATTNVAAGY